MIFEKGKPLSEAGYPGLNPRTEKAEGMIIEYDVAVPAFVVASWTDHGLHNRGTLEGFKKIASKDKWLLVHGRKKWWHFYQMDNVERRRQFFNRFLKGRACE